MIDPPVWSAEELDAQRLRSIADFRRVRLSEPIEEYSEALTEAQGVVEALLEATDDLSYLITLKELSDEELLSLIAEPGRRQALRYLAGPPISEDDWQILAEVESLSAGSLAGQRALLERIVQVVIEAIDQRRFPWVVEQREAAAHERGAAVLASACLIAYQRQQTSRRSESRRTQEGLVSDALVEIGFERLESMASIETLAAAPAAGQFCGEILFGGRKADFVVGLYDGRQMAIECKVSNSSTNSIKRLNNDAAVKAGVWLSEFGQRGVVPAAVLSGVFHLRNLVDAQARGLSIFWSHELGQLTEWVAATRNG